MFEVKEVLEHLEKAKRDFISDVRVRASDEAILLYVSRRHVAPAVKKGFTSLRQLKNLQKHLSEQFSTPVEIFFIQSESHLGLESSFCQLLNRRFNDQIRSFYISFRDDETVDAWIEVAGLTEEIKGQIEQYYSHLLEGADLTMGNVQWIDSVTDLPTVPAILRMIKTMQPVDYRWLFKELHEQYGGTREKWLRRKLDKLRKKKFIHWQKPDNYTLTANSLEIVPAGTKRSSSDINRALALGRRKW